MHVWFLDLQASSHEILQLRQDLDLVQPRTPLHSISQWTGIWPAWATALSVLCGASFLMIGLEDEVRQGPGDFPSGVCRIDSPSLLFTEESDNDSSERCDSCFAEEPGTRGHVRPYRKLSSRQPSGPRWHRQLQWKARSAAAPHVPMSKALLQLV